MTTETIDNTVDIVEEVVKEEKEETTQPSHEDVAREKGWKPLDEYEGEPTEWVDAKEFVAREPLFKGLHKLNRENKKLKIMLNDVKTMLDNSRKTSYEQAMKDLKAQYETAATEGNIVQAIEARDAMKTLEKTETTPVFQGNPSQEVYDNWVEQNPWFDTDPTLKRYANGLGTELVQELTQDKYNGRMDKLTPQDLEKIYAEVTKQVKEEFPNKFMNPNRKKTSVTESSKRTTGEQNKTNKQYSISDLPDEETRKMATRFIRNKIMKEDEYIKAYREGGGKFKGEA